MPIYEYECSACGNVFETFQKITDDPLEICDLCEGPVHRLISQCSFQLKGNGWYVTDYKRGGATSSGNGGSHSESRTEEKADTKTEDKTETKTETKAASQGGAATTGGTA